MVATDAGRVGQALSEADLPIGKEDLVRRATQSGADEDTVRALNAIPPVSYAKVGEVLQSVQLESPRSSAEQAAQRRSHTHPGLAEEEKEPPGDPIVDELGENRGS